MNKQEQIVREIIEMWTRDRESILQTWRDHCRPDFAWWNSGRGAVYGLDACLKQIEDMYEHLDFSYLRVPVKNLLAAGNIVIVERSDDLYRADGSLVVAVPVVGVVEFEGDKIKEWRDYCDDWVLKRQLQSK